MHRRRHRENGRDSSHCVQSKVESSFSLSLLVFVCVFATTAYYVVECTQRSFFFRLLTAFISVDCDLWTFFSFVVVGVSFTHFVIVHCVWWRTFTSRKKTRDSRLYMSLIKLFGTWHNSRNYVSSVFVCRSNKQHRMLQSHALRRHSLWHWCLLTHLTIRDAHKRTLVSSRKS